MKKIKLSRQTPNTNGTEKAASKRKSGGDIDARRRIQLALDELNAINSKSEIAAAMERNVAFSHEAFASRIGVGTDTLRKTNSDLFKTLKNRILELERIWGGPLRGVAAKKTLKSKTANRRESKKVRHQDDPELAKVRAENSVLKKLLENSQEEILDLTARLSIALQMPGK